MGGEDGVVGEAAGIESRGREQGVLAIGQHLGRQEVVAGDVLHALGHTLERGGHEGDLDPAFDRVLELLAELVADLRDPRGREDERPGRLVEKLADLLDDLLPAGEEVDELRFPVLGDDPVEVRETFEDLLDRSLQRFGDVDGGRRTEEDRLAAGRFRIPLRRERFEDLVGARPGDAGGRSGSVAASPTPRATRAM